MKRIFVLLLVLSVAGFSFANGTQEKAGAKGGAGKWRIALSNNYAANSWRQQMLRDWKGITDLAKSQGLIAEGPAFTTNGTDAAEQAAQIQNLILEGYNAIVVNAASPTALNGAIDKAVAAGVKIVSFDQMVDHPAAYKLHTDFVYDGAYQIMYLAKRFTTGNLLEIRGLPGTSGDQDMHDGIVSESKKYPGMKIVGSVVGKWDEATAQKEVAGILPSLPKIDAVVDQGGDGYGAVMAFKAAGLPIPIVLMGHRYDELSIWKKMRDENGYETSSVTIPPSTCQIGFWVALEVLNGTDVPKDMKLPPSVITADRLDYFLKNTREGGVATLPYPLKWVQALIKANKEGTPYPVDPEPAY
jgi:ribose transport system substrate-binding protein